VLESETIITFKINGVIGWNIPYFREIVGFRCLKKGRYVTILVACDGE
jgi:hypothetical protein